MGTNYYLKRIPTEDEIAQCHKLLDERKIEYDDVYKEDFGSPYLEAELEKITKKNSHREEKLRLEVPLPNP